MVLGPLRFTNASGGTADWVYPGPAIDLQSPASAQAANGTTYLIYAEEFDRSQWEIATGAATFSGGIWTFARTTVLFNSDGTTSKINFANPPQVSVYSAAITPASIGASTAFDCGRLTAVSTTQIKFSPFNGDSLRINGGVYQIPSGGITAANSNVFVNGVAGQTPATATFYYIYLFSNAGTLTVDFSTTGHATDTTAGNVGTEIKNGDATRTLIGAVYFPSSGLFIDTAVNRFVVSWFNQQQLTLFNKLTANATSVNSSTWDELSTSIRCEFTILNATKAVDFNFCCYAFSSGAFYFDAAVGFDSTAPSPDADNYSTGFGGNGSEISPRAITTLAEGHHYATALGSVSGGTCTYQATTANAKQGRARLTGTIWG